MANKFKKYYLLKNEVGMYFTNSVRVESWSNNPEDAYEFEYELDIIRKLESETKFYPDIFPIGKYSIEIAMEVFDDGI